MSELRKGSHVRFNTFDGVKYGTVVSMRTRKGCVLVEAIRTNPDVPEAQWWREPHKLTPVSA